MRQVRAAVLLLVAAVTMAVTLSSIASDIGQRQSNRFWQMLSVQGLEAESYGDLGSLSRGSDLVVAGRLTDIAQGREFGTESEGRVYTAIATLTADRVLAGEAPKSILLEVLLPDPKDLGELADALPRERALFFLRNKGEEARNLDLPTELIRAESRFYRLVTSETMYRDFGGKSEPRPGHESALSAAVATKSFDTLLAEVGQLVAD